MEKMFARTIYVMLPALFIATTVYVLFGTLAGAIITLIVIIGFGLDMTKAVPDRGER